MKKHIPNFITSLNLASGFIAAIHALNGNLTAASWFIVAAMIFDFLDGFSARMLKAYSEIGKELDSLADVVSFGVAPALILFSLIRKALPGGPEAADGNEGIIRIVLLYTPVIMPVFAALRLAIFNLDETQAKSFKGLPTPANALAVISLVLPAAMDGSGIAAKLTGSVPAILSYTLILSILMVTRIPLLSLKTSNIRLRGNEGRYILIIPLIILFAIFGIKAAPLIIPLYIISSLLSLYFTESKAG